MSDETNPPAGGEVKAEITPAAPSSEAQKTTPSAQTSLNGPFPEELNKWNWGAFFLNWIWAIGNGTWIGLLALISPISLIVAIILGIKGNEWAWQNRKFDGVDQFKEVQKKWAVWGLVLFILSIILTIAFITSTAMLGFNAAKEKANQTAINSNIRIQQNEAELLEEQLQEEIANTNSWEE